MYHDRVSNPARRGLCYGLVAYGWWGLVPLYFERLRGEVAAGEILAQRIVWSSVFLALVVSLLGRWREVGRCLRSPAMGILAMTAPLIASNWFSYIYSVVVERIREASLGFFITPLMSVLLGMVVFRERLRPLQWLALVLALVGVVILTHAGGTVPWIALVLAVTFSTYGLFRKLVQADPLVALFVETLLLAPVALAYLLYLAHDGRLAMGCVRPSLDALIVLSGVVTAIPLMAFAQAAKLLPLSTLGFLQYLSPSVQLAIAVLYLGEPFDGAAPVSFLCIWTGLLLFSLGTAKRDR